MANGPTLSSPMHLHDYDVLVGVWLTRIVINNTIAMKHFCNGMYSEEMRILVGIEPTEGNLQSIAVHELAESLARRADSIQHELQDAPTTSTLYSNLSLLSDLLNLDNCQQGVLAFAALCQHHMLLREVLDQFNSNSCQEMTRIVAMALKLSVDQIHESLNGHAGLVSRRLVLVGSDFSDSSLQLKLNPDLYKVIFSHHNNISELMDSFIEESTPTRLARADFKHLEAETHLLESYLTKATGKSRGINVLIYGPTGSGKTEYVKWLSAQLSKKLYQVKSEDKDARPITGVGRLAFFQFSQQFLKHANAMLVFDEIEDIFPAGDGEERVFYQDTKKVGKAWLNGTLETNPVPTIWISNSIGQIDKAYLRRFDFSVEIGIPPLAIRRRILRKYLGPLKITSQTIDELAQHKWLSPAQIERAAKVLKASRTPLNEREHKLALLLNNSMRLLRQLPTSKASVSAHQHFEVAYINTDHDVNALLTALKANGNGAANLCFHGEPGTGKTSLAHYIAKQLQRPLMVKTAAELLSPYLGETEQNMAEAFKLAERDRAILLIDEADSFLSSRQLAARSWEVTQTNQMLTLIESFNGILICSTNRLDSLDEASLRRFTFKIKFDYLTAEQRWLMFKGAVKKVTDSQLMPYRAELDRLHGLSLGDFATVRKQSEFSVTPFGPEQWLAKLKAEIQYKQAGQQPRIGFIA